MIKKFFISLVCLVLVLTNLHFHVSADNSGVDSAWDFVKKLNVGWNLGNSLENQSLDYGFIASGAYGGEGFSVIEERLKNPVTTKAMIDAVAEAGFSSIRIPLSFYNHLKESFPKDASGPRAGTTIDENWLIRIKEVVDWALDAGLYVVINNHHDTSMWMSMSWIFADEETYTTQENNFVNLWSQVAAYFKNYDNRLVFQSTGELVNPEREFSADYYRDFQIAHDLNQAFIHAVRQSGGNNANRFLILETYAANSSGLFVDQNFYKEYKDSAKDKLIFGVHNYSSDVEVLKLTFKELYKRAVKYGMPFVIDECGTMVTSSPQQRIDVAETLASQAKKYGMAIMVWDDNVAEFGLIDRELCESSKKLSYRESYFDGTNTHALNSKAIVEAMINADKNTTELSDLEKQTIINEKTAIVNFVGLNNTNKECLKVGQYSDTNPKAFNPISEYVNTPTNFAAMLPYYYAEGAHFVVKAPQSISNIVIKEMDSKGHYLRSRYTSDGGLYIPSEDASFIGIYFRGNNNLTIDDYLNYVKNGELLLSQNQIDYSAYSTELVSAIKGLDNKTTIKWNNLQIADGYRVYRKDGVNEPWRAISNILSKGTTSFVDETDNDSKTLYTVKAFVEKQQGNKTVKYWTSYNQNGIGVTTKANLIFVVEGGKWNDNTDTNKTDSVDLPTTNKVKFPAVGNYPNTPIYKAGGTWYKKDASNNDVLVSDINNEVYVQGNTTYVFKYNKAKFEVIYTFNGIAGVDYPSNSIAPKDTNSPYEVSAEVTIIDNPGNVKGTKEGKKGEWQFSGWTSNASISVGTNRKFTMIDSDVEFTGNWIFVEADKFKVTYEFEGIKPINFQPATLPKQQEFYVGEKVKLSTQQYSSLDTLDQNNNDVTWRFLGWTSAKQNNTSITINNDNTITMPNADVVIYGTWKTEPITNLNYSYTIGKNQTYYLGSNKGLTGFEVKRSTNDKLKTYNFFDRLELTKGSEVWNLKANEHFEYSSGSLKHNIKASFLETLNPGTYTLTAYFKDNKTATTTIEIIKPSPAITTYRVPSTGVD